MNKKRWMALAVAGGLFLISIVTSVTSFFKWGEGEEVFKDLFADSSGYSEEIIEEGNPLEQIVVLDIEGVIQDSGSSFLSDGEYNHRLFLKKLNDIENDGTVKGIILRVNTPGGTVVESAEIHDKLVEIMDEKGIPVYVSMGSQATSGGYYVSAPASKIFASEDTITGSIGVILESYNVKELADKLGIDVVTIKSGPYKDIMSTTREMTEEERQILESMLNNAFSKFVQVIADGRGMTEEEVRKLADGRIYDGRQAKELGLVDDFGYLEDVISAMQKDYDLHQARVVRYVDDTFGLSSLFGIAAKKIAGTNEEKGQMLEFLLKRKGPMMMYIYEG